MRYHSGVITLSLTGLQAAVTSLQLKHLLTGDEMRSPTQGNLFGIALYFISPLEAVLSFTACCLCQGLLNKNLQFLKLLVTLRLIQT
jgi:hypothetical protein